jgi:N6-adenosine-specific RNA methylase IME4
VGRDWPAAVRSDAPSRFRVILADPPWSFEGDVAESGRHVSEHYDVMSLDEIKAYPVSALADEDAVLFMWTTGPQLQQAFSVIEAWGFSYKTIGFNWVKQNKSGAGVFTGMGYYTRSNAELCLLATKGKILPRKSNHVHQLIVAPRREHSRKPDEVYDRIEALYDGPPTEKTSHSTLPCLESHPRKLHSWRAYGRGHRDVRKGVVSDEGRGGGSAR